MRRYSRIKIKDGRGSMAAYRVLLLLLERKRMTSPAIAEDTGLSESTIRYAIGVMCRDKIIEFDGKAPRPPSQKSGYGPYIWKLHSRLWYATL